MASRHPVREGLPDARFYWTVRRMASPFFHFLWRIRLQGLEHVPQEGAVVLVSNHRSNLDPPFLVLALSRPIRFMAKVELFRLPVLGGLLWRLLAFPVHRGEVDRKAVSTALRILGTGEVLGIFPEGSRHRGEGLGNGHSGAAVLALRTGAVVLPVGVDSRYGLFSRVTIRFGPPFPLAPRGGKPSPEEVEQGTRKIMAAIAALLPEGAAPRN